MNVVDLIAAHIDAHGYPPTVRELAESMRMSPAMVHSRLLKAERDGLIERVPGKPRAIRIRRST